MRLFKSEKEENQIDWYMGSQTNDSLVYIIT